MKTETDNVAAKLEQLLARCDRIRRGSEINRPVYFGAGGEQHAREVARRDAKTVDTALPSAARRPVAAKNSDKSRPGPAVVEPVTGA